MRSFSGSDARRSSAHAHANSAGGLARVRMRLSILTGPFEQLTWGGQAGACAAAKPSVVALYRSVGPPLRHRWRRVITVGEIIRRHARTWEHGMFASRRWFKVRLEGTSRLLDRLPAHTGDGALSTDGGQREHLRVWCSPLPGPIARIDCEVVPWQRGTCLRFVRCPTVFRCHRSGPRRVHAGIGSVAGVVCRALRLRIGNREQH